MSFWMSALWGAVTIYVMLGSMVGWTVLTEWLLGRPEKDGLLLGVLLAATSLIGLMMLAVRNVK